MKTKSLATSLLSILMTSAAFAQGGITVSNVTHFQTAQRDVVVNYMLTGTGSAVITLDILTNGVSIGAQNFTSLSGAVNTIVATSATATNRIYWAAGRDWPNHKIDSGVTVKVSAWALTNPPDYLVMDLASGERRYYTSTNALPDGGLANDVYKTTKLVMRRIPAGGETFTMGAPYSENNFSGSNLYREYQHTVGFSGDYYIGIYEFTGGQYKSTMGTPWYELNNSANPPVADKKPLYTIKRAHIRGSGSSYWWPEQGHAVNPNLLIGKLRSKSGGLEFDLPTEAQWEYACRAGTTTKFNHGIDPAPSLKPYAWFASNSDNVMHEVGLLIPNAWGLYDMHGNAWEFCLDKYSLDNGWWYAGFAQGADIVDPMGPSGTTQDDESRVMRGGSINEATASCRSAFRGSLGSWGQQHGFRVVCPAVAR